MIFPGSSIQACGGHREGDESFLECVVREINEELSYYIPPDRFKHLTAVDSIGEAAEIGLARGEIYFSLGVPVENLFITEGSLLIAGREDIVEIERKMAPTARFALRAFSSLTMERSQTDC